MLVITRLFFSTSNPELRLLSGQKTVISVLFPFTKFFADAPQPLFPSESHEADLEIAEGCFRPAGGTG